MTIETILAELKSERERLDRAIAALGGVTSLGSNGRLDGRRSKARTTKTAGARKRRSMTAERRKKLSLAMKKRWAERKRKGKTSL